ncbi:WhiB family transcriptional regulator [Streptomyces sp. NPDC088847]|uniref:WhiB family transcriptional regulator n=1 Tax=Streptomyces sp. NPDC088847 TaxID=3365909 RepID=UPI00382621E7
MSYIGARPTEFADPDPRFPFPYTPTPPRCQAEPQMFDFVHGDRSDESRQATEARLSRARRACSGCSIVRDCLRWALVNKPVTKTGVFAATTPSQRTVLRKRLADRLGPDWIDVLARQDQTRRERAAAARHTPPTVDQARIIRLDLQVNGPMPLHRLVTPQQQEHNRARLMASITAA